MFIDDNGIYNRRRKITQLFVNELDEYLYIYVFLKMNQFTVMMTHFKTLVQSVAKQ